MDSQITIEDFKRLVIRVGNVRDVRRVPRSRNLYGLLVDLRREKPIQIIVGPL